MLYVYEEIIFYPDETYLTGLSDKSLLLGTAGGKQGGGNESLKFVFLNKRRVSRHLEWPITHQKYSSRGMYNKDNFDF